MKFSSMNGPSSAVLVGIEECLPLRQKTPAYPILECGCAMIDLDKEEPCTTFFVDPFAQK